jgi:hypothetical protein
MSFVFHPVIAWRLYPEKERDSTASVSTISTGSVSGGQKRAQVTLKSQTIIRHLDVLRREK